MLQNRMNQALEKTESFNSFLSQFYLHRGLSDRQIRENVKVMIPIIYNSEIAEGSDEKWWFQSFHLMQIFLSEFVITIFIHLGSHRFTHFMQSGPRGKVGSFFYVTHITMVVSAPVLSEAWQCSRISILLQESMPKIQP